MTNYVYPKFDGKNFFYLYRIGGSGLGNLLFTWARAIVYAKENSLQILAPCWPTLKIGTLFRKERDKRFYNDLFTNIGYITGTQRLLKLFLQPKYKESINSKEIENSGSIIVFEGMGGYFLPLLNYRELIKLELLKIVRPANLININDYSTTCINVHVRLGDFRPTSDLSTLRSGAWNYRIPIDWYVFVIESIRIVVNLPVCIFSDGTDEELEQLLKIPNSKRVYFGSSIADLLALSSSKVLIASGSTFSMWASFLGQSNTIYFPGLFRQKLILDSHTFEGEFDLNGPMPIKLQAILEEHKC